MDNGRPRGPTVYLHVGPPKTGTTYIQSTLRAWHKELKRSGVLYPGIPMLNHFTAALDARGNLGYGISVGDDQERKHAAGAWGRLLAKTTSFDGTVVISHEVFASADDEHARAAVRDLEGTDLHLVVTARDPARQIVSAWQQRVRQGSRRTLASVARSVREQKALSSGQDISALTERWGHGLAPDHVHVVTVPPPGADPTALWNRFADVVGIDPVRFDTSRTQRSNEGRGWVEVELLRRVNVALDGRIPHPQFNLIVHRFYAGNVLAGMPASRKVMLPANLREVADEIAERWIETIKERGYQIVGDIEDLRPTLPDETSVKPTESEIAALAVAATAELLLEVADREEPARRRRRRKRSIQRKTRSILRTGKQKASGRSARG